METLGAVMENFSWDFLTSMSVASVAVLAVANTLKLILKWPPLLLALLTAGTLTLYAACLGDALNGPGAYAHALFQGFLLFCIATGGNQAIAGVAERVCQPKNLRVWGAGGWWDTWFK